MGVKWPITGRLVVQYVVEARFVADWNTRWTAISFCDTRRQAEDMARDLKAPGDPRFTTRARQYLSQEPR